jgi:phage shock protein E
METSTRRAVVLSALCALALSVLAPPAAAAEHTKDSLDAVKAGLKDQKAVLVDVREQSEWDAGHLQGATLLPLSQLREGVSADELARLLPKDKVVYCHCAAGVRVLPAADLLKKHGYDVRPLKQGYKDLLKSGFPKAEK